jgi:hypothetical protein
MSPLAWLAWYVVGGTVVVLGMLALAVLIGAILELWRNL